jgi:serine/threonine protein kinase
MATSTRPDYGPDLLTDEENQQLDNFFSVRNTIDHPNERSAFNEETDVDHIQRWAGYAFQRATTPLTEQPPCEYIDGVSLDWSGHGTSHVDYNKSDVLPLTQGKFLGHGMHGGVYETSCNGVKLAWKRKYCRRKIGERERREIEVIKKLSHRHIIRLMGTYTHGPFLGLLLWPVATCDLASLLEDVDWLQKPILLEQGLPLKLSEEWTEQTEEREARLQALGILLGGVTTLARDSAVAFLKSTIGCIASAVAYIHESDIKHKDLKPSNILLSRNGLWLTDFGTATDFSVLTTSVTDNGERGTPKYFAPEVARFEPSGRAADIFSMGCIFFEIMILCIECSLDLSVTLRSRNDRSFQSNLDNVKVWLIEDDWSDPQDTPSTEEYLSGLVGSMMDVEVDKRPTASIVEWDVAIISGKCSAYRSLYESSKEPGIYRDCCYQEAFRNQSRAMLPILGTEVMINITFGRTYLLPPYQNIWTFHIGYVDENLIQSVQMFAVSSSGNSS